MANAANVSWGRSLTGIALANSSSMASPAVSSLRLPLAPGAILRRDDQADRYRLGAGDAPRAGRRNGWSAGAPLPGVAVRAVSGTGAPDRPLVEHRILVGVVRRAGGEELGDECRLAAEALPGYHDRPPAIRHRTRHARRSDREPTPRRGCGRTCRTGPARRRVPRSSDTHRLAPRRSPRRPRWLSRTAGRPGPDRARATRAGPARPSGPAGPGRGPRSRRRRRRPRRRSDRFRSGLSFTVRSSFTVLRSLDPGPAASRRGASGRLRYQRQRQRCRCGRGGRLVSIRRISPSICTDPSAERARDIRRRSPTATAVGVPTI